MGHVRTLAEIRERYRVDEVAYVDEIKDHLKELSSVEIPTLLLLEGPNTTDSGKMTSSASFEGISEFEIDRKMLADIAANNPEKFTNIVKTVIPN